MEIIEILLFVLLSLVCVYSAYSDIRSGIISNKILFCFLATGIVCDFYYYLYLHAELQRIFGVNVFLAVCASFLLYALHIWAGGDSKLFIVASLLYPAKYCFGYNGFRSTFIAVIPFSFSIGFIFLVVSAAYLFFKEKRKIDPKAFGLSLIVFLKRYAVMFLYTVLINILCNRFLTGNFQFGPAILFAVCFCIPWIINAISVMRNKYVLTALLIVDLVMIFIWKNFEIIWNPNSFLIVFISAILQILLSSFSYQTIPTNQVKKGMILSLSSSIILQNSRVKGMPGISTEDLASRLSEQEADSIRRWETSANGRKEIIIVRKVPFAIFIGLGILFYFFIWIILP